MPNEREKGAVKALKRNFSALVCFYLACCEHFPQFYDSLCLQNNFGAGLHFKMGLPCTEKPFLGFVMLLLILPPSLAFHPTQAIFALDRLQVKFFPDIFLSPPNLFYRIYLSFFPAVLHRCALLPTRLCLAEQKSVKASGVSVTGYFRLPWSLYRVKERRKIQ